MTNKNIDLTTVGGRLKSKRVAAGLTQEELAESLYVSRTAISKWESGRGYPNIDSLKAISKFFSVTIDELLDEIHAMLDKAWTLPLSGGKCTVDADHLRDIVRYIHEHLMEPLTVQQFAQALNYSLGHINRIFR